MMVADSRKNVNRGRRQCPERADNEPKRGGVSVRFRNQFTVGCKHRWAVTSSAHKRNGLTDRQRWVCLDSFGSWLNGSESPERFPVDVEPWNVSWNWTKAGRWLSSFITRKKIRLETKLLSINYLRHSSNLKKAYLLNFISGHFNSGCFISYQFNYRLITWVTISSSR